MAEIKDKVSVMRITETGNREATVLEHNSSRLIIDDQGGMIPEFSYHRNNQLINAHWLPWFRSHAPKPYRDAEDGSFWKANLLYHVAGNFPCLPNFGPGHIVDGINMPPHGWTANNAWKFVRSGIDEESGGAWAVSAMESPEPAMPLSFRKLDVLFPAQQVHYSSVRTENTGDKNIEINAAFHNTLGPPLLSPGCRISGVAGHWATPPRGGEFDTTTRLILGAEFSSLEKAPLAQGGKTDISVVPGPLGYTDLAVGVVPSNTRLGWSALVNPFLKLAYISFFTGPAASENDDVILRFNDFWMQYGGRPYTPWAPYEGGTDQTYCLGAENSLGAYAYGLDYARNAKTIMGAPATVTIPAHDSKTLRYGVLFSSYDGALDQGIRTVEADTRRLICTSPQGSWSFDADPAFSGLKKLESNF
jgi:hypothetical protein